MSFVILHRVQAARLTVAGLLVLGVCFFGVPAAALADGGSYGGMSMPMGGYGTSGSPSTSTAGGQGQTVTVHISNFSFGNPLTVAPGTTVQWINDDSVAHTVTADGGAFDSGSLTPGATFSFTFSQAGDFPYYCRFHGGPGGQGMSSRVTVTAQAGAPAGQNPAQPGYGSSMNMPGGNSYQAPSYGNTYKTPGYGTTYRSQAYGKMYKAPAYGSYGYAHKAPSYSNTYRAPSYGNAYRVPSYANRYAAPQCHNSYSSGYAASRYGSASAYSHYFGMPNSYRTGMSSYGY